jgi:hypothetical protein
MSESKIDAGDARDIEDILLSKVKVDPDVFAGTSLEAFDEQMVLRKVKQSQDRDEDVADRIRAALRRKNKAVISEEN